MLPLFFPSQNLFHTAIRRIANMGLPVTDKSKEVILRQAALYARNMTTVDIPKHEANEVPDWLTKSQAAYTMPDSGNAVASWEPKPGEECIGQVVKMHSMKLGGMAMHLDIGGIQVLHKRGGNIFIARCHDLQVQPGDWLYIKYKGDLPAKEGQSPARDWNVIKLFV